MRSVFPSRPSIRIRRAKAALAAVTIAALCLAPVACDRAEKPADSTAATADRPPSVGTDTPANDAPTARPHPAARPAGPFNVLMIDGQTFKFPAPRARVEARGAGVGVSLSTDNDATAGGGAGLSLQMEIDDAPNADVDGAEWHYKADGDERADSPDVITLGSGQQLQPYDVRITFATLPAADGTAPALLATLEGRFTLFDTPDAATAARIVAVRGTLRAEVDRAIEK